MPITMQKHHTFEDLYRQSKKTRGRLGLNPDPDKRPEENPWQKYHFVGKFKLVDLISKTIKKDRHTNKQTKRDQNYLYARFSR
jgi:hypothetical protein